MNENDEVVESTVEETPVEETAVGEESVDATTETAPEGNEATDVVEEQPTDTPT